MDVKDMAMQFEAVKASLNQNKEGLALRLVIHPNDCPRQLLTDWVGTRYAVALVRLDDNDQPTASEETVEATRAVQSAGMLCRNEAFQKFMTQIGLAESSDEQSVAEGLRNFLGVSSRSDIKNNEVALKRFNNLREQFMDWRAKNQNKSS